MKCQDRLVDSFDVVEEVISIHNISHLYVRAFSAARSLQEILSPEQVNSATVERAIELQKAHTLSFWDAYSIAAQEHQPVDPAVFCAALWHDSVCGGLRRISSDDVSCLRQMHKTLEPKHMLALLSQVETCDGEILHIPMLDFQCPSSSTALPLVISAVKALTRSSAGLLLESGRSYHYYGMQLLTSEELITFLARAMLLGPIIDRRWIAHRLLDGMCSLRISPGRHSQSPPFIVAELP